MKISIGPYRDWWGPYQIADLLQKVGVSEDTCHKLGERLSKTWVNTLCEWIHSKKKRKVKIHIDRFDTWNMDATLAMIVLPMLKQLKETKHGSPFVDDNDVPAGLNLRSTEAPPKEDEWDIDENHHKRWDWVLDEMIWAFEQKVDDDADSQFFDHSECPKGLDAMLEDLNSGASKTKYDRVGHQKWQDRKANGFRLFGKYYEALWD